MLRDAAAAPLLDYAIATLMLTPMLMLPPAAIFFAFADTFDYAIFRRAFLPLSLLYCC